MNPELLPLVAQSDGTLFIDERHPAYADALGTLRRIAELQKRPGALHTYLITPISLWNAAAGGWTAFEAISALKALARYGVPGQLERLITETMERYGMIKLGKRENEYVLRLRDRELTDNVQRWLGQAGAEVVREEHTLLVLRGDCRGSVKRELAGKGYPVVDEAGFRNGQPLRIALREAAEDGTPLRMRDYQAAAVDAFLEGAACGGGSGVVVLPCGAGKTWVGIEAISRLGCETLILTPNAVSVMQWMRELLRATTLTEDEIGEYNGQKKQVRPVTVATYQALTHRRSKEESFRYVGLFKDRDWGLIVYDEVHLLPAPVFRMTADIQATRRLGLTATLVREDGREGDVFALIGPKAYDAPWKQMEAGGWIAEATCIELRVPFQEQSAMRYASARPRDRHRIAGENPLKAEAVKLLLRRHQEAKTLVIGQYLSQLRGMADELDVPLVTGEMPHDKRRALFDAFNRGEIRVLLVSKVANFAVDLPDASVAIQVSGSYGSRQEEAQRLGRLLRPKKNGNAVVFYTLVTANTSEIDFARHRAKFLIEQGYVYETERWEAATVEEAKGVAAL